ncbi:integrase catalytic domain-containing protein [Trichonephila clavipes]|nr:integrase catalytic domain-containing protein [Trichonephila clavipes]
MTNQEMVDTHFIYGVADGNALEAGDCTVKDFLRDAGRTEKLSSTCIAVSEKQGRTTQGAYEKKRKLIGANQQLCNHGIQLEVIDVLYKKNKEQKNSNTVDTETLDSDFEEIIEDNDTNIDSEKELSLEQKLELATTKNISTNQNTLQKAAISKTIRREIDLFEDEGFKGKYLEKVYRSLLTVPPTSVDAERAFSTAERLEDNYYEFSVLEEFVEYENFTNSKDLADLALEKIESYLTSINSKLQFEEDKSKVNAYSNINLPKYDLPQFAGDFNSWLSFKSLFSSSIDSNESLTDIQKLQYLQSAVTSDASRLIKGFAITHENYKQAWEILLNRKKELTCNLPNFIVSKFDWPHINGLQLADPSFYISRPVDMILGVDIFFDLIQYGKISGTQNQPSALNSWLLSGKVSTAYASNLSEEDQKVEKFYLDHTRRNRYGRNVVSFPFKNDNALGDSKVKAKRRFFSLEKRLQDNPELRDKYVKFMQDYEHLGHMQLVPNSELSKPSSKRFYFSHFGVIREQSETTKLRVVFDASAKTDSNLFLNDILHTGPKTIQQLVEEEIKKFPEAFKVALEDFYVDDLITGTNSKEDTKKLVSQVIELMKKGGFPIRKWASNESSVLESLPPELRSSSGSLHIEEDNLMKILGIIWNSKEDTLRINISPPNEVRPTKRQVLSTIAKIYDPSGFLSPTTIQLKILMQDIWKENISWDDPVTDCISESWTQFKNQMKHLAEIQIPRYLSEDATAKRVLLIGFCDASQRAYAAVFYLRTELVTVKVHVSMITSKTRVAPVKSITLPRLELLAALFLSELYVVVLESLRKVIQIDKSFLFSDSQIVLDWLK